VRAPPSAVELVARRSTGYYYGDRGRHRNNKWQASTCRAHSRITSLSLRRLLHATDGDFRSRCRTSARMDAWINSSGGITSPRPRKRLQATELQTRCVLKPSHDSPFTSSGGCRIQRKCCPAMERFHTFPRRDSPVKAPQSPGAPPIIVRPKKPPSAKAVGSVTRGPPQAISAHRSGRRLLLAAFLGGSCGFISRRTRSQCDFQRF
jgi:hypothetical protein